MRFLQEGLHLRQTRCVGLRNFLQRAQMGGREHIEIGEACHIHAATTALAFGQELGAARNRTGDVLQNLNAQRLHDGTVDALPQQVAVVAAPGADDDLRGLGMRRGRKQRGNRGSANQSATG